MKLPSELSVTEPLSGPESKIAVRGSASLSVSLDNTPLTAVIVRDVSSSVE